MTLASLTPSTSDPQYVSSVPKVISWFSAVAVGLFCLTKWVIKFSTTKSLGSDDLSIALALFFSIGFVVAVTFQSNGGLGRPQASLSEAQLQTVEKSIYAANFMYISSLFFSKATVLLFLKSITPIRSHLFSIHFLSAFMLVWTVSSVFANAFECLPSQPWDLLGGQCFNVFAFWLTFGILNILSEASLIALPIAIISLLQTSWQRKFVLFMSFSLRALVIGAIIAELRFRTLATVSTEQVTAFWPVTVSMIFVQALSIIVACVYYLRPFFTSIETGMIRTDDERRTRSSGIHDSYRRIVNESRWNNKKQTAFGGSRTENSTTFPLQPMPRPENRPICLPRGLDEAHLRASNEDNRIGHSVP